MSLHPASGCMAVALLGASPPCSLLFIDCCSSQLCPSGSRPRRCCMLYRSISFSIYSTLFCLLSTLCSLTSINIFLLFPSATYAAYCLSLDQLSPQPCLTPTLRPAGRSRCSRQRAPVRTVSARMVKKKLGVFAPDTSRAAGFPCAGGYDYGTCCAFQRFVIFIPFYGPCLRVKVAGRWLLWRVSVDGCVPFPLPITLFSPLRPSTASIQSS